MALDAWDTQSDQPGEVAVRVRLLGTGAAAPTKQVGRGITVTRTGAGVYKLTFAETPGTFELVMDALQAVTPGDIKNHSLIWDTYDTTTRSIEVTFWDAAGVAHDLAANEYILATLVFQRQAAGI